MLRNIVMDGSLQKIDGLFPGIEDVTDPDFQQGSNVNAESNYGSKDPEITLVSEETNDAIIYLQEHAGSASNERIRLQPGSFVTLTYTQVKAMDTFYVTGQASDVLFVIVR